MYLCLCDRVDSRQLSGRKSLQHNHDARTMLSGNRLPCRLSVHQRRNLPGWRLHLYGKCARFKLLETGRSFNARIPPIIRQSKLLPTAALAEPTAGKLSLTARPAANNAANARLWLVRTAPRSANRPVPDLPSPQKKTATTMATLRV